MLEPGHCTASTSPFIPETGSGNGNTDDVKIEVGKRVQAYIGARRAALEYSQNDRPTIL